MSDQLISFPLFGEKIEIGFKNSEQLIIESYKYSIIKEALRLQKIFNLFDEESELSILNKKKDKEVSKELLHVLKTALEFCELSNNDYDISKGYNFMAFKHNHSYKELSCSYKDIIISNKRVKLNHKDVVIDLGSIAKGFIVDKLATFIHEIGFENFYIDARGDLKMHNYDTDISVQDPRMKRNFEFKLEKGGVATSGDYRQFNENFDDNHVRGESLFSSVTVINDSLMIADVLATTIMINDNKFLELIKKKIPGTKILVFDKKGEIVTNDLVIPEVTVFE